MLTQISDSEMEIMTVIWEQDGPVTSALLSEKLASKNWKPTTLLTFLSRLCSKGILSTKKIGTQKTWSPLVSREEYKSQETLSFLKQVHGGSVRSFLSALTGDSTLSKKDLGELGQWLDEEIKSAD